MDTLKIPKATLAGHSMGSFIAEYLAIDSPDRVDEVILVGAAASGVGNEPLDWVLQTVEQFTDPIDPKFIVEWTSNPNPVDEEFLKNVMPETAKVRPTSGVVPRLGSWSRTTAICWLASRRPS